MNGDSGGTSDKIQSIVSWTCRNDFSGLSGDTHLLWILQVVNDRTRKEQLKIFAYGEVAEWPIVQHWKCCVRVTGPGVRIPPSPLNGMPLSHTLVTQRQVSDQGTTEKKIRWWPKRSLSGSRRRGSERLHWQPRLPGTDERIGLPVSPG